MAEKNILYASNAKYWYGSSTDKGDDTLYSGYHKSSKNYRSWLQFNPSTLTWGSYNVSNITITKAVLYLYPRGFYADSVKTAATWIAFDENSSYGESNFLAANEKGWVWDSNASGSDASTIKSLHTWRDSSKPTTYDFSKSTKSFPNSKNYLTGENSFIKRLEKCCKDKTPFNIFITGDPKIQGVIFTGINPISDLKSLVPVLKIEYVPSASTGSITTSIGNSQVQATVKITRNVSTYTHGIVWTINGESLEERSGIETSDTFKIDSDALVKKYFPAAASSINCSCKIITYSSSTQNSSTKLGEKSVNFTLSPPTTASVTWGAGTFSADNENTRNLKSNTSLLISGYSIPSFSVTATSNTGSSIKKYKIIVNSCGISETKTISAGSLWTSLNSKTFNSSSSNRTFTIKVQAIDARGAISSEKAFTKTCYGYFKPKVDFSLNRYSAETTTPDPNGTYITTNTKTISYATVGKNNVITQATMTAVDQNRTNITVHSKADVTLPKFNYYITGSTENTYTFTLKIWDNISTTASVYTYEVESASFILHIKNGGKALGIGAAAQTDGTIYCGWDLNLRYPLKVEFGGTESSSYQGLAQNLSEYLLPITGGTLTNNLTINRTSAFSGGIYLKDSTGATPGALYYNGANLWIGSTEAAAKHHTGGTYISAGYNGTKGNDSIYISIPNKTNDGASSYKAYHAGNIFYSADNNGAPSSIPNGEATQGMIWLCPVD